MLENKKFKDVRVVYRPSEDLEAEIRSIKEGLLACNINNFTKF